MEERWKGGERMGGAYIRIYVCQEGVMTSSLLWREEEKRVTAKNSKRAETLACT